MFTILKKVLKYKEMVGIVILLLLFFWMFLTIQGLKNDNTNLQSEVEETKKELTTTQNNLEYVQNNYSRFVEKVRDNTEQQQNLNRQLKELEQEQASRVDDIRRMFKYDSAGNPVDFNSIIQKKPTMLERRINDATSNFGSEIENITR